MRGPTEGYRDHSKRRTLSFDGNTHRTFEAPANIPAKSFHHPTARRADKPNTSEVSSHAIIEHVDIGFEDPKHRR
jgi:hypothetical protein